MTSRTIAAAMVGPRRGDRRRSVSTRSLGGSLAGVAGAVVLAHRFERVTIVERDGLPLIGEHRKGVLRGRHVHVLVRAGLGRRAELFPGVLERLRLRGRAVFEARGLRFNSVGESLGSCW